MAEKRFEPFFGKKLPEVLELEGVWREFAKSDLDCKHTVKSHFVIEKRKLSKLFGFMATRNHLPTIF